MLAIDTVCVHIHAKDPLDVVQIVPKKEGLIDIFKGKGDAEVFVLEIDNGLAFVFDLVGRHIGIVFLNEVGKLEGCHAEDEHDDQD